MEISSPIQKNRKCAIIKVGSAQNTPPFFSPSCSLDLNQTMLSEKCTSADRAQESRGEELCVRHGHSLIQGMG